MTNPTLVLSSTSIRDKACNWIRKAPDGTRVTFADPRRTKQQNDRLWPLLTIIAQEVEWHGLKLSTGDWKLIFMDALGHELRLVPNINGTGFVNLGRSSKRLSKDEFSQLMDLIEAFAAERGVDLKQDNYR